MELARFGGIPVRKNKIYYGHQCIDEQDLVAVSRVLTSDYITCGPAVQAAEEKLRKGEMKLTSILQSLKGILL